MREDSDCHGREMWKHHPHLPIEVSNLGRVRKGDRILSQRPAQMYYSRVTVFADGRRFERRVHRLVGETWLDATPEDCVLHRDEELPPELLHSAENLWLGTRIDNHRDRDRKGRLIGKQKNCIPQHLRRRTWALRTLGLITREIADILGLTHTSVINILDRDTDTNFYINQP